MPALNRLYREYRDRVEFYVVYIEEAHPIDAWQVDANLEDDVLVATTRTSDERYQVAGLCVTRLGIELPALVDESDNRVERAYTAWPDRLYVIDRNGLIAHKSAAGPFGFKPADVEATLKRILTAAPGVQPAVRLQSVLQVLQEHSDAALQVHSGGQPHLLRRHHQPRDGHRRHLRRGLRADAVAIRRPVPSRQLPGCSRIDGPLHRQGQQETNGELVGDLEIVRIPLDLYRTQNATSRQWRRPRTSDRPVARSPVFLVGDSAVGSPYLQSISLGFECAMLLAGLLAQRDLRWTRCSIAMSCTPTSSGFCAYMRSKMIKHNKELFGCVGDPLTLLQNAAHLLNPHPRVSHLAGRRCLEAHDRLQRAHEGRRHRRRLRRNHGRQPPADAPRHRHLVHRPPAQHAAGVRPVPVTER